MLTLRVRKRLSCLSWVVGILFALSCLVFGIPLWLFVFYPYNIVLAIVYLALAVLFPILYYKLKKKVYKIISFGLFCVPACVLIIIFIAMKAGWVIIFM